jgi:hypothetical protein
MKRVKLVLCIFMLSQVGFTLPVKAQSSCQATINSVVNELQSKGVKRVLVDKENIRFQGNPTNRKDLLKLGLSPYNASYTSVDQRISSIITNIMNSPVLLTSYADRIVSNCKNIAVVMFGLDQSDAGINFVI